MLPLRSPRVERNVPLEGAPCPPEFPRHGRKHAAAPHLRANENKGKAFSLSSQAPEDSASFTSEAQTRRPAFSTYAPSLLRFEECFVLSLPHNKSQGGLEWPHSSP